MALASLIIAATANGQAWNGTISRPDTFGNQHLRFYNGVTGTFSRPDVFGNQYLRYNNGGVVRYGAPDVFGNRSIQVQTMPRRGGW